MHRYHASMAPMTWITITLCVAGLLEAVLLYLGLFQDRSRGRKRCPKCWYNMTGSPSLVCPECGHDARDERRLYRTRRRRWATISAAVLAIACGYLWPVSVRVIDLSEPLKSALRPTSYLLAVLPNSPRAYQDVLVARIRRCGVWPWEERLLLWSCDTILKQPTAPRYGTISLLRQVRGSRKVTDRLWELHGHPDPPISQAATYACLRRAPELTDSQLSKLLDDLADCRTHSTWFFLRCDELLTEMLRRKRPEFRAQIERDAAGLFARAEALSKEHGYSRRMDLECLTALRRWDGKPDPLKIRVNKAPNVECTANDLPTLHVAIENVDVEGTSVGFTYGGDYRGGRPARWRIEVHDQAGREMPLRPPFGGMGGWFSPRALARGKCYEDKLDMDLYVLPLPPGKYQVRVLYHNSVIIADYKSLPDLILSRSDPFELVVHPAPPGAPIAKRPPVTTRWYGDANE